MFWDRAFGLFAVAIASSTHVTETPVSKVSKMLGINVD